MSQTIRPSRTSDDPGRRLPGLPTKALPPRQRIEALRRVDQEAEQRVKLGMQLYLAAEHQTMHQRELLEGVKAEQHRLKEKLEEDIARNMHAHDQWAGKIDAAFTDALHSLEKKIDNLQNQWSSTQQRIDTMMRRSEALLDQSRTMVKAVAEAAKSPAPPAVIQSQTSDHATAPIPDTFNQAVADVLEQVEKIMPSNPPRYPVIENDGGTTRG